MWTKIFATYVTDRVALLVHGYLLTLSVLATVCCIRGILWEVSGPLNVHDFARKLVIWGVSFEAIFTIALFMFDEGISGVQQATIERQRAEIISLERRLAARSLSDEQVADVAAQLKPFAGQHFDIVTYWRNPESLVIANRIYEALLKADWIYDKPPSGEFILGVETGVVVLYDNRSGDAVAKAVKAFVYSLLTNDL
jgi:hypothetical protein